jgi:hypothetical protein
MASVYLARDAKHRRQVAIKVFRPELTSAVGAARFLREIEITAQLQHPHIVPLFDSGEADGVLYYVMPHVAGESLRTRLGRPRRLAIDEALEIGRQVASALAYAHNRQVIHRDIKPENILLSEGVAMVADFGIARAISEAADGRLTGTGLALGTPMYMSPEQGWSQEAVDERTDIYALGCVLFEMLAGRPPFVAQSAMALLTQHVADAPPLVRSLRPDVPRGIERVLEIALAKSPSARFASAGAFAEALRAGGVSEGVVPSFPAQQRIRPARKDSATAPAPNAGRLVSRMCDRWKQVNAFDAFFRSARARWPGRPHMYVIHGEEGESHDSLVERLLATRVTQFASELAGEDRGAVLSVKVPWPVDDDLATRRRDLAISLFREVAPSYMGEDLSADALVRVFAATLNPIAVVTHELRSASWDGATESLIRWYLDEFWGTVSASSSQPMVLVFLKIIYQQERRGLRLPRWLQKAQPGKEAVRQRLDALLSSGDMRCPSMILGELSPVGVDDVKGWFSQHGIYESEQRRHILAESLFRSPAPKRMAEIELALEQIHRDFLNETLLERSSLP